MKSVKDLLPSAVAGGKVADIAKPQAPASVDEGTASVVNALFVELQSIFPAWRQAWPNDKALDAAKRSWIKGFMTAGINSVEQIRFGILQCRKSGGDFAPSVGRFIRWCEPTPEMLGLPVLGKAYREACANSHPASDRVWSHVAVHHAACETGFYELANWPEERSKPLFGRNYTITCRMVMEGQPLREIPLALPEKVSVRTEEVGRAALSEIRKSIRGDRP